MPGHPFDPDPVLVANWQLYYDLIVKPIVMAPVNRSRLDQFAAVARLPFDPANYLETVEVSVADVLRYSIVNLKDAATTLGGFPFDNTMRWYAGSTNDLVLNLLVRRSAADPEAIAEMQAFYQTSGVLERPLVTLHTLKDQQVPYWHEYLYALKTLASGALLTRHLNVGIDRFGHCRFTLAEVLGSFVIMLVYDGLVPEISGTASLLTEPQLATFEHLVGAAGLRARREGDRLRFRITR